MIYIFLAFTISVQIYYPITFVVDVADDHDFDVDADVKDKYVGDGDLGVNLEVASRILLQWWNNQTQIQHPARLFRQLSEQIRRCLGGTSGPLYRSSLSFSLSLSLSVFLSLSLSLFLSLSLSLNIPKFFVSLLCVLYSFLVILIRVLYVAFFSFVLR
jgi:hypothetical protein